MRDQGEKLLYPTVMICFAIYLCKLIFPAISTIYEPFRPFVVPYSLRFAGEPFATVFKVAMPVFLFLFVYLSRKSAGKETPEKIVSVCTFNFTGNREFGIYAAVCVLAVLACAMSNLFPISSLPYWKEDSGSFIARYINLHESLPSLTYYDPFWHAGYKAFDCLRSGVLGIYLMFYPLLLPDHIDSTYKFIVPVLILMFPFLMYAGASLFKLNRWQSLCVFLFSFVAIHPHSWFSPVKLMKYGVYPYFLTSVLFAVCLGLLYRVITDGKKWRYLLFFCITLVFALPHLTFVFMMAGPASWLIFLGIRRFLIPRLTGKTAVVSLITAAVSACLFLFAAAKFKPEIFAMGIELFTMSAETYKRLLLISKTGPYETLLQLWQWMSPRLVINAVVFLLGGYQIFLWIKENDERGSLFLFSAGWLIILGVLGSFFLRGSQPVRYLTPAALVLLVPFGHLWCRAGEKIKEVRSIGKRHFLRACMVFLFVNMAMMSTSAFSFVEPSPPRVTEIKDWIEANCTTRGRVFLELDANRGMGGMPGRLQQITGMHFMGEKVYDPDHHLKLMNLLDTVLNEEYFHAYNIQCLMLTDPRAKSYCEEQLGLYPVKQFGPVAVYQTNIESSFFIKGRGTINAGVNEINVELSGPVPDTVVIRFHYEKGIKTKNGITVFKVPNQYGKDFIGFEPDGRKEIRFQW